MKIIELLEWDSVCFGKRIGKFTIQYEEDWVALENTLRSSSISSYDLLYIFVSDCVAITPSFLKKTGIKHVDTKCVYNKFLVNTTISSNSDIYLFKSSDNLSQLYQLAFESGQLSRFKTDKHFSIHDFTKLYMHWIDNSVAGFIADAVYVHKIEDDIMGMVTLKIKDEKGMIGLIATDTAHRSTGIGKALLDHTERFLIQKGVYHLEVVTQDANKRACQFYERNGFICTEKTLIYHFWND